MCDLRVYIVSKTGVKGQGVGQFSKVIRNIWQVQPVIWMELAK